MAWFTREKPGVEGSAEGEEKRIRTEGLWLKCESCSQIIWKRALDENFQCCPKCDHHFRLDARARLALLLDGDYQEFDSGLRSSDPLKFEDTRPYSEKLKSSQSATQLFDAVISASGTVAGRPVNICSMESKFIGGSMGAVVGEVITRAIERSLSSRAPLIIVSATGGARMQEGAVSLMQMAKISAALMRLDDAKRALHQRADRSDHRRRHRQLRHAGRREHRRTGRADRFRRPRVIEQSIRQKLPEGFQRSEFLLEHGFLDAVVKRAELKNYIARSLRFFCD